MMMCEWEFGNLHRVFQINSTNFSSPKLEVCFNFTTHPHTNKAMSCFTFKLSRNERGHNTKQRYDHTTKYIVILLAKQIT